VGGGRKDPTLNFTLQENSVYEIHIVQSPEWRVRGRRKKIDKGYPGERNFLPYGIVGSNVTKDCEILERDHEKGKDTSSVSILLQTQLEGVRPERTKRVSLWSSSQDWSEERGYRLGGKKRKGPVIADQIRVSLIEESIGKRPISI